MQTSETELEDSPLHETVLAALSRRLSTAYFMSPLYFASAALICSLLYLFPSVVWIFVIGSSSSS